MDREEGVAPLLTVAAVARRLGVAPATLRTWDRRYGLGPSEHAAGAHRRYGSPDLARLIVMRRLTIDGVAPAEAAEVARGVRADDVFGPLNAPGADSDADPVASDAVVDAALGGDREELGRLLALRPGDDVLRWWETLVEPAISALSRRTVVDRPGVAPMLALGTAATTALQATVPPPVSGQPVIFVLATGMRIGLVGVHAVAAALAERGADARVVSGFLSARQAVELVAMTRAGAVITVTDALEPDLSAVERLAEQRPDVPQFVMLPDAAADHLPLGRSVYRARTVTGTVHEALAAVGLTGTGQLRASVRGVAASHSG
ncbi:MAG TPA: MerR family transcriptional regulator [Cellulomonas sp.]